MLFFYNIKKFREQYYLDLLFNLPSDQILNLSKTAGSTLGFKHREKFSLIRRGVLRPMYNREKSPEFIYIQKRDKTGKNNPQYGKLKSSETLDKLRKYIYVYDEKTSVFLGKFGRVQCKKTFIIGYDSIQKYLDSGKPFKGRYF